MRSLQTRRLDTVNICTQRSPIHSQHHSWTHKCRTVSMYFVISDTYVFSLIILHFICSPRWGRGIKVYVCREERNTYTHWEISGSLIHIWAKAFKRSVSLFPLVLWPCHGRHRYWLEVEGTPGETTTTSTGRWTTATWLPPELLPHRMQGQGTEGRRTAWREPTSPSSFSWSIDFCICQHFSHQSITTCSNASLKKT